MIFFKQMFIIQMSSILLSLYHKRLQNLDKTISSLHETVENDPALKIMQAPQLLRYKIDRVNELVKQIINSEKEQIIIYLLNMCENNTEKKYTQDYKYQGKQNNQKQLENEIKMFREETEMLKKQLIEEKQKANEYKFQIQQFQVKYNKLELSNSQQQSQDQNREKELRAQRILLDEKEHLIQLFRQKNLKLEHEISDVRQQLEKQTTETRSYKSQVQQLQMKFKQKVQPMRLKVQRIESIKKQMDSLFNQLHTNKEILFTLKQSIGVIIKKDLQELRKDYETLKFDLINVFFKTIKTDFQQIKKEWMKRNLFVEQKTQKEQQLLLQQMNQIQKQMDSFISTKIKNI